MRRLTNYVLVLAVVYSLLMFLGAIDLKLNLMIIPDGMDSLYVAFGSWLPPDIDAPMGWFLILALLWYIQGEFSRTRTKVAPATQDKAVVSADDDFKTQVIESLTALEKRVTAMTAIYADADPAVELDRLTKLGEELAKLKALEDKIWTFGPTGDVEDYLAGIEDDLDDLHDSSDYKDMVDQALALRERVNKFIAELIAAADRLKQA